MRSWPFVPARGAHWGRLLHLRHSLCCVVSHRLGTGQSTPKHAWQGCGPQFLMQDTAQMTLFWV